MIVVFLVFVWVFLYNNAPGKLSLDVRCFSLFTFSIGLYIHVKKKNPSDSAECVFESEWFTADKYPTEPAVQEIDERQPWLHDLKFSMRPPK